MDNQRNAGLHYARTVSPNLLLESTLGYVRSTPSFVPHNGVQPALNFGDGLFEPFNSAGGTRTESFGNVFQIRQTVQYVRGKHNFQAGFEARYNRDSVTFGISPNGSYTFGGGTTYSSVSIVSASGKHDIQPGDPLPDSLTGLLTATPYSYTNWVASPGFPQGDHIDEEQTDREAYNFYFQDTWKATPRLTMTYGLRYELGTSIHERNNLTSGPRLLGPGGKPARYWDPGAYQTFVFDPQPPYDTDRRGWGPRILARLAGDGSHQRACGRLHRDLVAEPVAGQCPYRRLPDGLQPVTLPRCPGAPVPFENAVTPFNVPPVYTPEGQPGIHQRLTPRRYRPTR